MKQARFKDLSRSIDSNTGPIVTGSANVLVNNRPACRVGDVGVYNDGIVTWDAQDGAPCVLINGRRAHRLADGDHHAGVKGTMVTGSSNVAVGNYCAHSCDHEKTWIELCLIDAFGRPVPGAAYILYLPDGGIMRGRLDANGKARVESIRQGSYSVSYPEFSDHEWK